MRQRIIDRTIIDQSIIDQGIIDQASLFGLTLRAVFIAGFKFGN
jgi:hypothetical protein